MRGFNSADESWGIWGPKHVADGFKCARASTKGPPPMLGARAPTPGRQRTFPARDPLSRHMCGSVLPALLYFQVFSVLKKKAVERGGSR